MGPLSVQNTQTHTHIHTYTHACIVCILGVSIFWRHYPMYFINSSSSSACRSTRLPRRQVPVMEYTHNIQHTNTHTHTAQAQQESSERLAQLSSLSSRRSLSLLFVRHCAKMGLGCCQWGVFNVKDFDFTHLTVNALLTRPTIRKVCVQISNRFKNSLKLKNVSF